jgi:ATP-binding cassette, subfamily B, bacterial
MDLRDQRTFQIVRFLKPYLSAYPRQTAALMVAVLGAAGSTLLIGHRIGLLVDETSRANGRTLGSVAVLLSLIAILAISSGARFHLSFWIGERIAGDLRKRVFDHLLTLSPDFFEKAQTGDLLSRLNGDITLLQVVIGASITPILRNVIILVGAIFMLFHTSTLLACLVVTIVPVMLAPLLLIAQRAKKQSRTLQDNLAQINSYAEETLNAARTMQAFTREQLHSEGLASRIERTAASSLELIRTRALVITFEILVGLGAVALALWVGGNEVESGRMSQGAFSAFILYAVTAALSGSALMALNSLAQGAHGAAERVIELLQHQPSIKPPAEIVHLPSPPRGAVEFDNVTHCYPSRPEQAAIADFSLRVEPGESVALVGPSGSGKSTVFQLLFRFYDPVCGTIRIDGVDVKSAAPAEVRRRIAVVPQEPVIFSADAWENIRYARYDASDREVRRAADAAGASEFLEQLPNGFATFLGEKGFRLSGGQRQRIAIARAILRDAPILLLDEATSALDAESEAGVQKALAKLGSERTTIVIAHRLATIRRANRIIVLDRGRQVATGTHEKLVTQGGLYAHLASLQFNVH